MFGFNQKPKKDVQKRAVGKSRISVFFEIFFRKIWRICKLNILYMLCAIPIFIALLFVVGLLSSRITDSLTPFLEESYFDIEYTKIIFDIFLRCVLSILFIVFFGAGPVTAGFSFVLRNFSREDHSWVASDFFQHTKTNFLQSIIVFVIDILVFCLLVISFLVYSSMNTPLAYAKYIVISFLILYMMMHLYIYPLMVTFSLSLKDIYKNSILLALVNMPKNMLLLIMTALIHFVIPYFLLANSVSLFAVPLYFIFEIIALVGITGFMSSFFTYPSIEMLIDASNEN